MLTARLRRTAMTWRTRILIAAHACTAAVYRRTTV
jgi:hypothetical protein